MRWPLRLQLLVPVLLVVMTAIIGSSLFSAYLAADWVERRQEENLARVVKTLTDASFPLTEQVLRKMSGLSGAEFAVLDAVGKVQESSRRFAAEDLAAIQGLPLQKKGALDLGAGGAVTLSGARFLAARVPVLAPTVTDEGSISTLAVLYPEEQWSAARRQAVYPALAVGAVALALAALVTALLARRVVRPLEALRRQAAAIEQGDFRPVPPSRARRRDSGPRPFDQPHGRQVGPIRGRRAAQRTLAHSRAAWGRPGAPSSQRRDRARLALDLHRRRCPVAQTEPASGVSAADGAVEAESLEVAARQFALMETYLQRFLTLGRRGPPQMLPLDLGTVVERRAALGPAGVPTRRHRAGVDAAQ